MNRTGNYSAFYVAEPFNPSNLGACATRDFCYYNTLKMWKAKDSSFPFVDSHDKTYNVRDDSDWEKTLKPRLRERLRCSKNLILFLSSITKNSQALYEEIDYGINTLGLPIIVVYPELSLIHIGDNLLSNIVDLWNRLPIFRNSKKEIPVLHVIMRKDDIANALKNRGLMVQSKIEAGDYVLKQNYVGCFLMRVK